MYKSSLKIINKYGLAFFTEIFCYIIKFIKDSAFLTYFEVRRIIREVRFDMRFQRYACFENLQQKFALLHCQSLYLGKHLERETNTNIIVAILFLI